MCDEENVTFSTLDRVTRGSFSEEVTFERTLRKVSKSAMSDRKALDCSESENNHSWFSFMITYMLYF